MSVDVIFSGFPARLEGWPEKGHRGALGISTVALVRSKKLILFDTGHYGTRKELLDGLKARNLTTDSIDIVVLSHLHWDHVLNVDLFPNAQFILHEKEYEHARSIKGNSVPKMMVKLLEDKDVKLIEGEFQLAKNVRIIETPGHTVGGISLAVKKKKTEVLAGDIIPNARAFLRGKPDLIAGGLDLEAAKSVGKIASIADVVYPGHDRPFLNKRGAITYLQKTGLAVRFILGAQDDDFVVRFSTEDSRPVIV